MRIFLLLFLFSATAQAQSVSLSPTSFSLWGQTPSMGELAVHYQDFGLHYFHSWNTHQLHMPRGEDIYESSTTRSGLAVSYTPIKIGRVFRAGGVLFASKFPVSNGQRLNFFIDAGYSFDRFRISYNHLSNGFGAFNDINPGVDMIRLMVDIGATGE